MSLFLFFVINFVEIFIIVFFFFFWFGFLTVRHEPLPLFRHQFRRDLHHRLLLLLLVRLPWLQIRPWPFRLHLVRPSFSFRHLWLLPRFHHQSFWLRRHHP